MKVLIAGGDGFIGWPLSLSMSKQGWNVLIVDNLSRRRIDEENGYCSITPIKPMEQRLQCWKQITHKQINFAQIDLAHQKQQFFKIFEEFQPDVIVHLAEQRSAPYSMKSLETIDYTIQNNSLATKNILMAVLKFNKDCQIVHIGTMGVYGYETAEESETPEGFCMAKLNCTHQDKCECKAMEIVHPYYPGSIYHMTKCLDNVTLLNFQKFFNLKITQLHQGIVWGVSTPQTELHPTLVNRIDVDSDFGTVLNRFCCQVASGYPITLYGKGKQTRAFININDSMKCIKLAIQNTNKDNKIHILNQVTATHQLNQLKDILLKIYPQATYQYLQNPREEKQQNNLKVKNDKFKKMGYTGIEINEEQIRKLVQMCKKYSNRFQLNLQYIKPISFWKGLGK